MFKEFKKQAKTLLFANYCTMIFYSIIFMFSNSLSYLLINEVIAHFVWENLHITIKLLTISILGFLQFFIIPLSQVGIFKSYFLASSNENNIICKTLKFLLKPISVKKIVIINFLPRLLYCLIQMFSSENFYFNLNEIPISPIAAFIALFINYKFFVANYYVAISDCSAKNTIYISCNIMKKRFLQYLIFLLSFIGWICIAVFIRVILEIIITGDLYFFSKNYHLPYLEALRSFGYGINFFLLPYMYISQSLFLNSIINNKTAK